MRATLAACAALLISTCSLPPSTLERVQDSGELRVLTRNSPTTYYLGRDGEEGFEYDLAAAFADHLGVDLRMEVPPNMSTLFDDLEAGRADFAAAGLSITDSRRERFDFSEPYLEVTQQLVYRYGRSRPRDPGDIEGTVKVVKDSTHEQTMEALADEYPELDWEPVEDVESEELLRRVADREIDYTVADSTELRLSRRYQPELRAAFDLAEPDKIAWAFPKDRDGSLQAAAEGFLASMGRRGNIARIEDRYFGHTERFDYVGTRRFMRHIESRLPSYRNTFEEAAERHDLDWRLLAAIGYQESHWDPSAVSPTGVRGIMMLTQRTAADMGVNRLDAEESIRGGAAYFASVHERMPEQIPEPDRTWMALAAYNVGFYHVMDARMITEQKGYNPDRWVDVRDHLPLLSQREYYTQTRFGYARGHEPVIYVDNIRRYYDVLAWQMPEAPGTRFTEQEESGAEEETQAKFRTW